MKTFIFHNFRSFLQYFVIKKLFYENRLKFKKFLNTIGVINTYAFQCIQLES